MKIVKTYVDMASHYEALCRSVSYDLQQLLHAESIEFSSITHE